MANAEKLASQPRTWGYVATLLWAFVAFIAGQIAALAALLVFSHGNLNALRLASYDGAVVTLSVLVLNPVSVLILLAAARLARAHPVPYLALTPPAARDAATGFIGIIVLIALTDALLYFAGRAIVSPFQVQTYFSAADEGWLAALWFATVVVAPAGEEIQFRGFMFRGLVRSPRSVWPGITVIALLWAGLHLQYDWTGILEIFVAGLFLGWVRWRSGSTLLTFALHALFNCEGMIETVVKLKFFS